MKASKRLAQYLNFYMRHKGWENSYIHPFLCFAENRAVIWCDNRKFVIKEVGTLKGYQEVLNILHPMREDEFFLSDISWFGADNEWRVMAGAFLIALLEDEGL